MLRTLYSKLALTLFALLSLTGLFLIQASWHSSEMYQQEVAQKLNHDLADHIVEEYLLFDNERVNEQALEQLFHLLMVINPSIELYLLDTGGEILAYSAPEGKVKRARVDLKPVRRYLEGGLRYPLLGDDPRDSERKKVFSAARIPANGRVRGYLYIILGSELYENTAHPVQGSYIHKATSWGFAMALGIALMLGLLLFAVFTRRLKSLSAAMQQYAQSKTLKSRLQPLANACETGDEVDQLAYQFNCMADKIDKQLQELEKLDSSRREMVANVSHDLGTPLTSLQGYLETLLLKRDVLSDAEKQQYLEVALSQCKHLGRLVVELFELAKLDSCETVMLAEPVNLAELVQDVTYKLQLHAEENGVHLKAEIIPNAPLVHGDIGMMQRVLENLIENALRHTPVGGSVVVGINAEEDKVMVKVEDTGRGIPGDELAHIFERFYRVEKCRSDGGQGAGLGLAIAKRILELHGSTINVESEVDKGTTFSFQMAACGR